MTSETRMLTAPPAPHSRRSRSDAALPLRIAAWAIPVVYAAGTASYLVLVSRAGNEGVDPAMGIPLLAGFAAFAVTGAVLVSARPRNAVGWVLAGSAVLVAVGPTGDAYAAWATRGGRPADPLAIAGAWLHGWYWYVLLGLLLVYLPLLFPDGRLPSRRWWPVAVAPGAGLAGIVALGMAQETLTGQEVDYRIANPVGLPGLGPVEHEPAFAVLSVLVLVGIAGSVAAVVVRFRRSRGDERQQMKWFLFAVAPVVLVPLEDALPLVSGAAFGWLLLALPAAVAVAVLRYRLDGIDLVLDRTLVYGTLTALVIGLYMLVVGYLGAALRREDDLAVSLVATGLVAVLFAPARDRVQKAVTRLLYGRRAEPYAALAQLGERLGGTLAPDAVLPAIVTTVREELRLPYAAIWLDDDAEPVAAGSPTAATESLPLLHHGALVGLLVLGLRPGEGAFSAADRRLLADLGRQAGVAVSAVRLTADLRRSRERLVTAREEERRRLRRDLHDGLGAQLAGLVVQTGRLRSLVTTDPPAAQALAADVRGELRTAIADIRRLVRNLRPPALDELGLAGALQRLADSIGADGGVRITVDVTGGAGLPAAVEVAAYRIVQEALTNVVRHAGAQRCAVRIDGDGTDLVVTVEDDGSGVPEDLVPGVGLISMRERAAETGGSLDVGAGAAGGMRVTARLPLGGGAS